MSLPLASLWLEVALLCSGVKSKLFLDETMSQAPVVPLHGLQALSPPVSYLLCKTTQF